MDRRAAREVPWALLTYAASRGINILTTIALARLVTPHEFGLVALAALTIQTISLFNDLGLGGALITRKELDRRAMGTMLTLMLGMHALMTVVIVAVAPLAAALFREPRLTGILLALAGTVVLAGASWFQDALLQRQLRFRRRFVAQMVQSGVYMVVALALGFAGAGVWSIVIGQVAGLLVYSIVLLFLAPLRVRPAFDRTEAREAFAAGRGFMLQGGLDFLRRNVDYLAIGRFLGAKNLGYYSMAYRLGELPYFAIADPVARVSFPAFSKMHHADEDPRPAYLTTLRLVALLACPLGVLLSAAADPFTRTLFGGTWLPMIGPLAVIGIWAAIRPVQTTASWLLNSIGRAGSVARVSAVVVGPFIAGVVLAAALADITAVAWVVVAESLVSLVAIAVLVRRHASVSVASQWRAVRPVVAGCVAAWPVAAVVSEATERMPPPAALALAVAAGAVVYVAVVSLVAPGTFPYALSRARGMLGRGGPVGVSD
jgi:PST family polysaccharide transporter